jgi:YHS domain-containing protein
MLRTPITRICGLLLVSFSVASAADTGQTAPAIPWRTNLRESLNTSAVSQRPVCLFFYQPENPACSRCEANLASPQLAAVLGEGTIPLKVNVLDAPGTAKFYHAHDPSQLPMFVLIGPDEKVLASFTAAATSAELLAQFQSVLNSQQAKARLPQSGLSPNATQPVHNSPANGLDPTRSTESTIAANPIRSVDTPTQQPSAGAAQVAPANSLLPAAAGPLARRPAEQFRYAPHTPQTQANAEHATLGSAQNLPSSLPDPAKVATNPAQTNPIELQPPSSVNTAKQTGLVDPLIQTGTTTATTTPVMSSAPVSQYVGLDQPPAPTAPAPASASMPAAATSLATPPAGQQFMPANPGVQPVVSDYHLPEHFTPRIESPAAAIPGSAAAALSAQPPAPATTAATVGLALAPATSSPAAPLAAPAVSAVKSAAPVNSTPHSTAQRDPQTSASKTETPLISAYSTEKYETYLGKQVQLHANANSQSPAPSAVLGNNPAAAVSPASATALAAPPVTNMVQTATMPPANTSTDIIPTTTASSANQLPPPALGAATVNPPRNSAEAKANPQHLGLDGNCPVTLMEKRKWTPGDIQFGAVHRGRTYLFASPEDQKKFLNDPDKYSPVMSGHDPVYLFEQGQYVLGRMEYGGFCGGRLYLFANAEARAAFEKNRQRYLDAVSQAESPGRGTRR